MLTCSSNEFVLLFILNQRYRARKKYVCKTNEFIHLKPIIFVNVSENDINKVYI